jgi:hypothetical protein
MLSKSWSLINLSSVSVKLPTTTNGSPQHSPVLNFLDSSKVPYISLQMSLCLALNRISTTLFSKHSIPYSKVLERHAELEEISIKLPGNAAHSLGGGMGEEENYKRKLERSSLVMVAFAFMYLHRPFLGLSEIPVVGGDFATAHLKGISIDNHKEICVRHARE